MHKMQILFIVLGLSLTATGAIAESDKSKDSEQFVSCYFAGQGAEDCKNYIAAIKFYDSASKIAKIFPINDCRLVSALESLSFVFEQQGNYSAAAPVRERIVAIYQNRFGANHPLVAKAYSNAALCYRAQGKINEAEIYYRKSLTAYEKSFGSQSMHVAQIAADLGQLYILQGDYEKAEPAYKQAIKICSKNKDPESMLTKIQSEYALLLEDQGKSLEAKKLLVRSL